MDKGKARELKQMIADEMDLRAHFRAKRSELESMVDPITNHVRHCCDWWDKNLPTALEIVVVMDNGTALKLTKPEREVCGVETYLPYGVDYSECTVIEFVKDAP